MLAHIFLHTLRVFLLAKDPDTELQGKVRDGLKRTLRTATSNVLL